MAFVRYKPVVSKGRKYVYVYLVQNHWDKEKNQSRQKVVAYFGKCGGYTLEQIKGAFDECGPKCFACGRMDGLGVGPENIFSGRIVVLCKRCRNRKECMVSVPAAPVGA